MCVHLLLREVVPEGDDFVTQLVGGVSLRLRGEMLAHQAFRLRQNHGARSCAQRLLALTKVVPGQHRQINAVVVISTTPVEVTEPAAVA